jgi:hypothetical protein
MLIVVMLNVANDIFMLSLIMLSLIMLSLFMLSLIMLSLIMLSVVRLNVIILNVVASQVVPHLFGQAFSLTCIHKTDQKNCQRQTHQLILTL